MLDSPNYFLNEEEIVTDMLLYGLTEQEKHTIRHMPVEHLRNVCADLGPALIQHYRLEDEFNPHVVHDAMSDRYPIKVAYRVVARLWSRLSGRSVPSVLTPLEECGGWF